jgi:predicted nucleotidyltransferase
MGIDEILGEQRQAVLELAARHGARHVRVFGSIARGEATTTSDVDFLVNMDPGRSFLDLCALGDDLEDLLGRKVDLVTEPAISPFLRDRILGEAVPL